MITLPLVLEGKVTLIKVLVVTDVDVELILGIDFWKEVDIVPNFSDNSYEIVNKVPSIGVESNVDISTSEREALDEMLSEFFNRMGNNLGCGKGVEHEIDLGGHRPIKQRHYPDHCSVQISLVVSGGNGEKAYPRISFLC